MLILNEEVEVMVIPTIRHNEKKVKKAKQAQLDNWQSFGVYEEMPFTGKNVNVD